MTITKYLIDLSSVLLCELSSTVIARLMSKFLWSAWRRWRVVRQIPFPFRSSPVNRECSWKKIQIEKKRKEKELFRFTAEYTSSMAMEMAVYCIFFYICFFFHENSQFKGQQGKSETISLTLFNSFHSLDRL